MPKEKEVLPPELIKEVHNTEIEEDADYKDEERYTRAIYNKSSTYQLELVNKLLVIIKLNKQRHYLLVGVYPGGRHMRERDETLIKERFLIDLEKAGHLKNLYSRIVEVPDREGAFTSDAIIADFQ